MVFPSHGVSFPATSKVLALVIGAVPIALPLVMQADVIDDRHRCADRCDVPIDSQ